MLKTKAIRSADIRFQELWRERAFTKTSFCREKTKSVTKYRLQRKGRLLLAFPSHSYLSIGFLKSSKVFF